MKKLQREFSETNSTANNESQCMADSCKTISPILAIRNYCLNCHGGSNVAVRNCNAECSLHDFRFGIKGQGSKAKAIREFCLECMDGCKRTIRDCPSIDCNLYPFRFGKNPNRKLIGGNPKLKINK